MNDKAKENKMQEVQMLEQNLQNILLQKQAFQIELRETKAALKELYYLKFYLQSNYLNNLKKFFQY
mgnify:CR=1 FL=1